jgi:hypothetical protein
VKNSIRLLYFRNSQACKYSLLSSYDDQPQILGGHAMKSAAVGIAAILALLGTPVLAADMGLPAKAPLAMPPPLPVVNWTGCYIEGGGGYGLWNIDHSFQSSEADLDTVNTTSGGRGAFGTVGGGCDYQFPASNWVVGLLADYDFMDLQSTLQETLVSGNAKEILGVGRRRTDRLFGHAERVHLFQWRLQPNPL